MRRPTYVLRPAPWWVHAVESAAGALICGVVFAVLMFFAGVHAMIRVDFAAGGAVTVAREKATRLQLVNVRVVGRSGTTLLLPMTEPELLALVRALLLGGEDGAGLSAEDRRVLLAVGAVRR